MKKPLAYVLFLLTSLFSFQVFASYPDVSCTILHITAIRGDVNKDFLLHCPGINNNSKPLPAQDMKGFESFIQEASSQAFKEGHSQFEIEVLIREKLYDYGVVFIRNPAIRCYAHTLADNSGEERRADRRDYLAYECFGAADRSSDFEATDKQTYGQFVQKALEPAMSIGLYDEGKFDYAMQIELSLDAKRAYEAASFHYYNHDGERMTAKQESILQYIWLNHTPAESVALSQPCFRQYMLGRAAVHTRIAAFPQGIRDSDHGRLAASEEDLKEIGAEVDGLFKTDYKTYSDLIDKIEAARQESAKGQPAEVLSCYEHGRAQAVVVGYSSAQRPFNDYFTDVLSEEGRELVDSIDLSITNREYRERSNDRIRRKKLDDERKAAAAIEAEKNAKKAAPEQTAPALLP